MNNNSPGNRLPGLARRDLLSVYRLAPVHKDIDEIGGKDNESPLYPSGVSIADFALTTQEKSMLNASQSPWPCFSEEEVQAAANVIASNRVNYWTGSEGRAFEQEFADWCGISHAIAVTNGTVALDLALNACGIGPGDEVIVTPRTFIASVSSVVNAGATPIFADIDRDSGMVASPLCPRVFNEAFLAGTEPTEVCTTHMIW